MLVVAKANGLLTERLHQRSLGVLDCLRGREQAVVRHAQKLQLTGDLEGGFSQSSQCFRRGVFEAGAVLRGQLIQVIQVAFYHFF